MKPLQTEYPPYAELYVSQLGESENPIDFLETKAAWQLLHALSDEQSQHRYAEDKWSIKELLGHMIDTERIFAYRALCLARGEKQPLPGFDEKAYAQNAHFEKRTFAGLLAEYLAVREATLCLLKSFEANALSEVGTTSGYPTSVNALVYIIAGHERHHVTILKERYLH